MYLLVCFVSWQWDYFSKTAGIIIDLFGFQLRHWFQSVFLGHQFFFSKKRGSNIPGMIPFLEKKPILETNTFLGGGFKYFLVSSQYLGKISMLTNIFQMGWNHHLALEGCNFGRFATFLWDFSLLVPVGAWWFPLTLSYTSKKHPKAEKRTAELHLQNWCLGKCGYLTGATGASCETFQGGSLT